MPARQEPSLAFHGLAGRASAVVKAAFGESERRVQQQLIQIRAGAFAIPASSARAQAVLERVGIAREGEALPIEKMQHDRKARESQNESHQRGSVAPLSLGRLRCKQAISLRWVARRVSRGAGRLIIEPN